MENNEEQERKAELIRELHQHITRLLQSLMKANQGDNDDKINKLEALCKMLSPSNKFEKVSMETLQKVETTLSNLNSVHHVRNDLEPSEPMNHNNVQQLLSCHQECIQAGRSTLPSGNETTSNGRDSLELSEVEDIQKDYQHNENKSSSEDEEDSDASIIKPPANKRRAKNVRRRLISSSSSEESDVPLAKRICEAMSETSAVVGKEDHLTSELENMTSETEMNIVLEGTSRPQSVYETRTLDDLIDYDLPSKSNCWLCNYTGASLTDHYKSVHPESEVFISRLPLDYAKLVIAKASQVDYDSRQRWIRFYSRVWTDYWRLECRFCDFVSKGRNTFGKNRIMKVFYKHCTIHTGEYRYKCPQCLFQFFDKVSFKRHFETKCKKIAESKGITDFLPVVEGMPRETGIYGYICSACNFVQLKRENVETHINKWHKNHADLKARIIKLNMSADEDIKTEATDSPERVDCGPIDPLMDSMGSIQSYYSEAADDSLTDSEDSAGNHESDGEQSEIEIKPDVDEYLHDRHKEAGGSISLDQFVDKMIQRLWVDTQSDSNSAQPVSKETSNVKVKTEIPSSDEDAPESPAGFIPSLLDKEEESDQRPKTISFRVRLSKSTEETPGTSTESNVDGNLIENSANGSSIISNALASENSPPISLQKANEKNIGPEAEHVKSKPAVYLSQKALRQGTRLLKSPQTLEEMSDKIFHLYKCMGYACSYTTNSAEEFRDHFGKHLDERTQEIGFNKCAYCLEVFEDGKLLVEHILNIHSHCPFLCGYCFYRALDKRHVTIHQIMYHSGKKQNIIETAPSNIVKPVPVSRDEKAKFVEPYRCRHLHSDKSPCKLHFFLPEKFVFHLTQKHTLSSFNCYKCNASVDSPEKLLAHYQTHQYFKFQCFYCLHGTVNAIEMHKHLTIKHCNREPKFLERSLPKGTVSGDVLTLLLEKEIPENDETP